MSTTSSVAYYLKIDGIKGESQDDKHKDEIDIETWSWGQTNQGDAAYRGGEGAGKVSAQDMRLVAKVNKSSPKLFETCASGEGIKKAVLTATKAGKTAQDYLKITMHDLIISSYQTNGGASGVDALPTDTFTLNFSKMEMEYKDQQAAGGLGGSTNGGWDYKANKKV
jgi:type VI secretion system secreted protein Hcp